MCHVELYISSWERGADNSDVVMALPYRGSLERTVNVPHGKSWRLTRSLIKRAFLGEGKQRW